jgi:hypothetical protein
MMLFSGSTHRFQLKFAIYEVFSPKCFTHVDKKAAVTKNAVLGV